MKKRNRRMERRFLITAVVLLILVILAVCKLKTQMREENVSPMEEEQVQQKEDEHAMDESESEKQPENVKVKEEKRIEEELAAFLPDYTSAPLLNTTPIKCLTMELGAVESEVRFNWFSPSNANGKVHWKNTETGEVQIFEAQCSASVTTPGYYVNKATVTGLEAGILYAYQVGNDEGWSPEYTYQAPEETGNELTFLVTADAQIGQSDVEDPQITTQRWDSVVTRLNEYVPESKFMIHLGDQVASFGNIEQYDLFFEHLALYKTPLAPVVGNHDVAIADYMEKTGYPGAPYFYEHYNVPNRSDVAQTSFDKDGNYYFVRNGVLFLVLNSVASQPEAQSAYVAQIVSEHPEVNWRIIVHHYAPFSGREKKKNNDCREYLPQIAEDNDIDLVLSAHDHVYSRTTFVNGQQETYNDYDYKKGAVVTNPEGTLYITCSTSSGCVYHSMGEEIRIIYQGQPEAPMALRLDVTETELYMRAYLVDSWTEYDSYTIRKE